MKKLSPEKRNQLILTMIGTLALVGAIYFFLIGPQKQENYKLDQETNTLRSKLAQINQTIKVADVTAKNATDIEVRLRLAEADVATGDVFAWVFDALRQFKSGYQISIPNIGQPALSEVDLLAGFPYKQISVSLQGTGFYHDIGKFVADLENKFPHMRVVNLSLEPAGDQSSEKLSFRMEIVTLTKTSA
jgi:Tfp pilus assembly protein PilO